ncbi:MAG: nitrate/nitrite transporter NrtS [Pseudomonadota bacterium]
MPATLSYKIDLNCPIGPDARQLLVINQGDVVLAGTGIDWIKALLTYLVPYGVSSYSAVAAARERE